MIHKNEVDKQLANLGINFKFFGRPVLRELHKILNPGEQLKHVVNGFYQGGMALLVTTNRRLLLVDKKPLFLNLEDIRYEMISELDFVSKLMDGTLNLFMSNKKLSFKSYNISKLRELCQFTQDQITHFRQTASMLNQEAVRALEYGSHDPVANMVGGMSNYSSRKFVSFLPKRRPSKLVSTTKLGRVATIHRV